MKRRRLTRGISVVLILTLLGVTLLTGCGSTQQAQTEERNTAISPDLTYSHSMELVYAKEFAVDYYEDGYALITISDDSRFLLIPEGMETPDGLDEDIVLLEQPLNQMYLVASAVMDMFVSLDALDRIQFSALKADSWYVTEAREAMEAGTIQYAGKYSAPDYEQILSGNCGLAIENTMIYHTPEVKEQLERFGIPVMVDYSSYEAEPLGRTEWVKLYGLLVGKEEAAEEAFEAERLAFESVGEEAATGSTVAFFYISTNGEANVRKSSDYLPKMIELAGGNYIFSDLGGDDDSASSTVTMQMEEFYASAKNADYIIYNSTIDGELSSVEDLLDKSSLLSNLKAVQEGHVYCTTKNLYQSSMELGTIISDIHKMLTGEDDDLTYIYKLE
jgi:iron complex transport system substrate-binding protein